MQNFKITSKKVYWSLLLFIQLIPFVYPPNISIQLLVNSICCVALGSIYAITIKKGSRVKSMGEDDETLSMSDALKFPIMASGALLTLYVLFKNINNDLLTLIFKINFAFMGVSVIGSFLRERVSLIFPTLEDKQLLKKKVNIAGSDVDIDITTHNLISYSIGAVIASLYVITNNWFLSNLLGISFTVAGIMLLRISKFSVVLILLWILFFYDIFWVFGSDVMVTVAKKFDVPIKLLFPLANGKKSLLGLGDMVIPGLLTALALKFDVDMGLEEYNKQAKKEEEPQLRTFVFDCTLIGYGAGMIATFVGMSLMGKAQPALLYLVPTCSIGLIVGLIGQGRVMKAIKYESEEEVKEKEKNK